MSKIRVNGPTCPHCHRLLIIQNFKCMTCGHPITKEDLQEKEKK